jgi:hypothetical protein
MSALDVYEWEPRARALLAATRSQVSESTSALLQQLQSDLLALATRTLDAREETKQALWKLLLSQEAFAESQPEKSTYRVAFQAPQLVRPIGSYALGTAISNDSSIVDIAIQLPKKTFGEKDFLDGRYHVKRLLYLVEVVRQLQGQWPALDVTFETSPAIFMTEDALVFAALQTPVALLRAPQMDKVIRILPALHQDQFPRLEKHPEGCYWRILRAQPASMETLQLSARYNESIRRDMMILRDHDYLVSAAQRCAAFADTVRLLKLWAQNRRLRQLDVDEALQSVVSGHEVAMQVAHLIHQGAVPNRLTTMEPLVLAAFRALRSRVPDEASLLAVELDAALRSLASRLRDVDLTGGRYATLLGCSIEPLTHFDSVVLVTRISSPFVEADRSLAEGFETAWKKRILSKLRQAFGDRVHYIGLLPLKPEASASTLGIGFKWHDDNLFRLLDREPDEQIWSTERVEWRRFRTGEVARCIVWAKSNLERFQVPQRILEAALKGHAHLNANTLWLLEDAFLPGHLLREYDSLETWRYGKDPRSLALYRLRCTALGDVYRALCQLLLDVDGSAGIRKLLPLQVHAVHVTAPGGEWLRHAGVEWPELVEDIPSRWVSQYRLVAQIEMESTHLWPDKEAFPDAAQAVRVAFAIALCRSLETVLKKDPNRLPLPIRCVQVSRRGELHLLLGAFPVCLQIRSAAEVASELGSIRLHGQLLSLVNRFPALGPTARLVKRFLASHGLLDPDGMDGLSPVAAEVLVARLFTEPLPWGNHPATAWGGLVRFLHLLAKYDAAAAADGPLIVTVPGLSLEEGPWYPEPLRDEASSRSLAPGLRLCTSNDPTGSELTKQVAVEVVRRLRLVSRAALQHLAGEIQQGQTLELDRLGAIFRTAPLETFCDLVIALEPGFGPAQPSLVNNSSMGRNGDLVSEKLQPAWVSQDKAGGLLVDVHPVVAYVAWLRTMYGSVLVFLRDIYDGGCIGGIWRQHANDETSLDTLELSYRRAGSHGGTKKASSLTLNVPEMLHDMRSVGSGLVQEIRLCRLPGGKYCSS